MRHRIRLLHLSVALVAALFVVTLGVTGSIMAFEPEIDRWLHHDLWYVDPQARPLTLDEIGSAISQQYPGERISRFDVSADPNLAYRVALPSRLVYVNPYTARTIGLGGAQPDTLARIHQIHLRLLWMSHPDAGKAIVTWMCVAMIFLLVTGLYLWWPLKRFSLTWSASPRRRWLDVHRSTGITVFAFLLLAGVTGIAIGFGTVAEPAYYRLTGSTPSPRPPHVVTPSPAGPISPDRVMDLARAAIPGATPFQIAIPKPDGTYQVRMRFPEDLTPGGRSRVEIDQYTGAIVFAEGSRTAPAGTRAVILTRAIHTGDVFGMASRVAMSLASALTVVMALSGLLTWWARRRPQR